eukprot:TCALIF_08712-PA protein Name:"Similar to LAC Lachesin (Schistocerca americana)" AED:0.16 eAED:0.16 QI:0/0.6/0.5/0.66/0.6/0.83/6/36/384
MATPSLHPPTHGGMKEKDKKGKSLRMKWLLKFMLCVSVFKLSSSQKTPQISYVTPSLTTDIGGEAKLECTIVDRQDYPILWTRVGKGGQNFPIATGPKLLLKDQRFDLELNEKSGQYILSIRDVQPSDASSYLCQIVAGYNSMVTATVELSVKLPPVISDNTTRSFRVTAGEKVEMECQSNGFPTPRITWTREDGRMMPNGQEEIITPRKLIINQVRREDTGKYLCWAKNGVGPGDEHRMLTLEVEYPPIIEVPRPKIPQALNHETELTCKIQAFPPPAIHWRQGSEEISNSPMYHVSHFASQNDLTTSVVKILSIDESHYGNYTCEAVNRHGKATQTIELYQSQIPICPPVCGDLDLSNSALNRHGKSLLVVVVLANIFNQIL